jgi:hypothetical protein
MKMPTRVKLVNKQELVKLDAKMSRNTDHMQRQWWYQNTRLQLIKQHLNIFPD